MSIRRSQWLLLFFLVGSQFFASACATFGGPPYSAIPDRLRGAPNGTEFVSEIKNKDEYTRETAILRELRRGNLPNYLRNLIPIDITTTLPKRGETQAKIWVMPDYLSIGHDDDFIRIPMNPVTAQKVADHFGFVLPTKKVVDLVFRQSEVKLPPTPLPPGKDMVRTYRFKEHHDKIEEQMQMLAHGVLVAGHKKDVVVSNRLLKYRRRVAIYGWHKENGVPIQPLSTIHGHHYADYSHGVRLIAGMMIVDGEPRPVAEVLQDPELASIISDEGPLTFTRYQTEGIQIRKRWAP